MLQAVRTCGHELLHIYINNHYGNKLKESIGEDKFNFLNESLTVLLNLEFKDLWFVKDVGYMQTRNLRNYISQNWEQNKDFEKLLKKCVNYLKEI